MQKKKCEQVRLLTDYLFSCSIIGDIIQYGIGGDRSGKGSSIHNEMKERQLCYYRTMKD